ncbi:MAG TPA: LacI family DNA-binding transcriptional regulator [Rariglobus sp.]|jgi:DNA-binding LacI/PurR family transcriptional regulator|nr:LacI family DNA-binding transcriptional regulator [Rariglobus sp.]
MPHVTLKDVAKDVGLSVSCVARALKGRPDIPPATCKRVHEAADRLGYRPNPMLTALSAYRQANAPHEVRETLAFLTTRCDEKTWLASPETGDLLRGARQRAASLGYQLEYFNIGDTPDAHRQIARILKARGIRGILLRTFPLSVDEISLPFDQFTCINLFSEPHSLKLPTVSSYHAQSMELALQKLLERGCRHPALVLNKAISRVIHHGWLMAFKVYAEKFEKISMHLVDDGPIDLSLLDKWHEEKSADRLDQWAKKCAIDTLIYGFSENLIPEAHKTKEDASQHPLIVCMDLMDPDCGLAGIYQDRPQAGAMAVEWLQSMIMTAHIGVERKPTALMIPGIWKDGAHFHPRPQTRAKKAAPASL